MEQLLRLPCWHFPCTPHTSSLSHTHSLSLTLWTNTPYLSHTHKHKHEPLTLSLQKREVYYTQFDSFLEMPNVTTFCSGQCATHGWRLNAEDIDSGVGACVCVCASMRTCVYVWCVCVCVCVYEYAYVHVCVCACDFRACSHLFFLPSPPTPGHGNLVDVTLQLEVYLIESGHVSFNFSVDCQSLCKYRFLDVNGTSYSYRSFGEGQIVTWMGVVRSGKRERWVWPWLDESELSLSLSLSLWVCVRFLDCRPKRSI